MNSAAHRDVLGDHSIATETHALHEFVEGFTFVGGDLNHPAQFEVGDVLQQEDGPPKVCSPAEA